MHATRFIDRAAQLVESWPAIALMWAGLKVADEIVCQRLEVGE